MTTSTMDELQMPQAPRPHAETVTGFAAAAAAIDLVNADDPTSITVDGAARPLALVHGELAVAWLLHLDPNASEAQQLAARAHHLRRWASPRTDYPKGRAGYLRWRTAAKRRHADEIECLLRDAGIDDDDIERVRQLIRKERLGTDPAVQTHEDAVCLAFLDTQLDSLADQLGEPKTIDVLVKTARKMSTAGLATASDVRLSPRGARLLHAALAT
jgi:hypothetical protein